MFLFSFVCFVGLISYFAFVFSCHVCILHSLQVVHFNFFVVPSSCSFCVLLVSNDSFFGLLLSFVI